MKTNTFVNESFLARLWYIQRQRVTITIRSSKRQVFQAFDSICFPFNMSSTSKPLIIRPFLFLSLSIVCFNNRFKTSYVHI
ncbi:hypothetical protein ANCCAN_29845 [Ancylostoma caninum]|uniref:Uncharacterized protein n=1 Tax=Ancylostoma caninum TaxID=29170 RepID=A0A368EYM4_ANCCA|nr:hypothetical protein ANCCAN_29845 [Ancylostoma caninum]